MPIVGALLKHHEQEGEEGTRVFSLRVFFLISDEERPAEKERLKVPGRGTQGARRGRADGDWS